MNEWGFWRCESCGIESSAYMTVSHARLGDPQYRCHGPVVWVGLVERAPYDELATAIQNELSWPIHLRDWSPLRKLVQK